MPRNVEIERKFLVTFLPKGWRRWPRARIRQGYLPLPEGPLEVRLRETGRKCFLAVKKGHGHQRAEVELPIGRKDFDALWPLTRGRRVTKTRHKVRIGFATAVMDLYVGRHKGLRTVEVEFESLRASRAFRGPEWFGHEITGHPKFSNRALAEAS